jgi:hypothetical protein
MTTPLTLGHALFYTTTAAAGLAVACRIGYKICPKKSQLQQKTKTFFERSSYQLTLTALGLGTVSLALKFERLSVTRLRIRPWDLPMTEVWKTLLSLKQPLLVRGQQCLVGVKKRLWPTAS